MLEWWQSVILGIVEGVTEFLPISSTGHLTVAESLMGLPINDKSVTAYTAIIQIGAMIASIVYFFADIVRIAGAWFSGLANKEKRGPDFHLGWAIIAGFLVTAVIAFALKDLIEGPLRSLWFVVGGLLAWSVAMFLGDRVGKQERGEHSITIKDGAILGLIQSFALVPGVSRSGATISGGLFMGYTREASARYAFLLAIPAVFGSGLYKLKDIGDSSVAWGPTIVATVLAFFVGYAVIAWLIRYVSTHNFTIFVVYRLALAAVVAGLILTGVLAA